MPSGLTPVFALPLFEPFCREIRPGRPFFGRPFYRWVLREYGHANQPHLVRDVQQRKKILDVLESATRGLRRMKAVLDRVPEQQVSALLAFHRKEVSSMEWDGEAAESTT